MKRAGAKRIDRRQGSSASPASTLDPAFTGIENLQLINYYYFTPKLWDSLGYLSPDLFPCPEFCTIFRCARKTANIIRRYYALTSQIIRNMNNTQFRLLVLDTPTASKKNENAAGSIPHLGGATPALGSRMRPSIPMTPYDPTPPNHHLEEH